MNKDIINDILGIKESYELPNKMMEILMSDPTEMFNKFLKEESDFSFDWFTDYFQEQHSNRDAMMQDFTPKEITSTIPKLAEPVSNGIILDVCAGTGGLSIPMIFANPTCQLYALELSTRAVPLLIFNLAIRNVEGYVINGDVLEDKYDHIYKLEKGERFSKITEVDKLPDENYKADICITNPPYSLKHTWGKTIDKRFQDYGQMPTQYNDLAFVLHGLYHLKDSGQLFAILPHGVLFRANKEAEIRWRMLEMKQIHAIIGLPDKLFQNTAIPTCILSIKKTGGTGSVLFIDAKEQCRKDKKNNILTEEGIEKIIEAYKNRKNVERFANLAAFSEIQKNDFNLNIPRYVDISIHEPTTPLGEIVEELNQIDLDKKKNSLQFAKMCDDLTGSEENMNQVNKFKSFLIKQAMEPDTDYSKLASGFDYVPDSEILLPEIGTMERAQAGKIYPAGSLYIAVSACPKNSEEKWKTTTEPQELEGRYAVLLLNPDYDEPYCHYLKAMVEAGAKDFFRKYVGDAINISMEDFKYYKIAYHKDENIRKEIGLRLMEIEQLIEAERRAKEQMGLAKAWFLQKMFV